MQSPTIVIIADHRGTIKYANPAFCEVTGYSLSKESGPSPNFFEMLNAGSEEGINLRETISAGEDWRGALVNRRRNGEIYGAYLFIAPVQDRHGSTTHFIALMEVTSEGDREEGKQGCRFPDAAEQVPFLVPTARDTPEVQRLEAALRRSEHRFQAIFSLDAVGIAQVSLEGRWLQINQKLCDILGYPMDELQELTLQEISHPDDVEQHLAHVRRLLGGEIETCVMENRHIRKGGAIVWVNLTVSLVRDAAGVPEYFIAIVEDITQHKRTQEALLESEERFRLLADTAPVIIWESGPDAQLSFLNKTGLEFTGRSLDQELGVGWTRGVHPDDLQRCLDTYRAAFQARTAFSMEYRLRRGDGEYAWLTETVVPRFTEDGNFLGYTGTCFDITETRRIKEQLEQANIILEQRVSERTAELSQSVERLQQEINERMGMGQALQSEITGHLSVQAELREKELMLLQQSRLAAMGEMIGNIAHQWRQPLNLLGLLAQDLSMTHKAGKFSAEYLQNNVDKTLETIQHMSQTIDDFRNFFRPYKEKIDFRVLDVVEKTISLLKGSLNAQQIRTEINRAGDPVVHGYPNELSQVLLNILINARDAFAAREVKGPRIAIDVDLEGNSTVVTITDNAGGIPESIIDKIFDPYFTTKGPDKGTGVGLFMSKTIIEKSMGGSLSVRNVGCGAQFRIEL